MRLLLAALALCAFTNPLVGQPISVPSGQDITVVDVIIDTSDSGLPLWRFRFLAPSIARDGGSVDSSAAALDLDTLCNDYVLPRLIKRSDSPDQVIISVSDRPVEFGISSPEATQFL